MPDHYALLDRPEITRVLFYPRSEQSSPPVGAIDLAVEVATEVTIHCRWHMLDPAAPAILLFHGNGEIVADYDDLAPLYHLYGFSLFVADFRGYGMSGGHPSFSTMLADALVVSDAFHRRADVDRVSEARYIMGRSLGALSAVKIAATRPARFRGLILESGAAGVRGWSRFARPDDDPAAWEGLTARSLAMLRAVQLPLLTIHGERDTLIPLESALAVQEVIGSEQREIEIIPRAGHNDLLAAGVDRYFGALRRFAERRAIGPDAEAKR